MSCKLPLEEDTGEGVEQKILRLFLEMTVQGLEYSADTATVGYYPMCGVYLQFTQHCHMWYDLLGFPNPHWYTGCDQLRKVVWPGNMQFSNLFHMAALFWKQEKFVCLEPSVWCQWRGT